MSKSELDPMIKWGALTAVLVAISLFSIKFVAYHMTGSQALFSEAMESIVNVLASVIALIVIIYASKPADKDHPYGHGKVEYLSAALEGGLIAFAAFMIVVEAIQAIHEAKPLTSLETGVGLLAGTGVINWLTGYFLTVTGRRKGSIALEASGRHLMADFWTTAGVVSGLILVIVTKIYWIDIVLAILVSLHLAKEGYSLIRKAIGGLLDEEETSIIKQIQEVINHNKQPGIIQVHHLRVMRSGRYHHIDAHVVVPEFWTVEEAHDNTNVYERLIFKNYKFSGEVHFHIDPCRRLYCQFCNLKDCPVRQEDFKDFRKMTISELTDKEEPVEITGQT